MFPSSVNTNESVLICFFFANVSAFFKAACRGKCLCVWVQTQSFHVLKLYHQLGQFQTLCLINGLPLAPLSGVPRSVCSCSFCSVCCVCTQTLHASDVHIYSNRCAHTHIDTHTNTGWRLKQRGERANTDGSNNKTFNTKETAKTKTFIVIKDRVVRGALVGEKKLWLCDFGS